MSSIAVDGHDSFMPDMKNIGIRIKWRRVQMNLSQKALAQTLGVTPQQIQKYEQGVNMINAITLYRLSKILSVPLIFFFEEIGPHKEEVSKKLAQDVTLTNTHPLQPAVQHLVEAFISIRDPNVRDKILGLAQELARFESSKHLSN